MNIILNNQQKKVLKQNQETLAKMHEKFKLAFSVADFKNTAIMADKIGKIATWKIYQLNQPEIFAHIFAQNYTRILTQEDIVENCYGIDPLFIDEDYVVNKFNELREKLKLYPVEPFLLKVMKTPIEIKYFSIIICQKNSADKEILNLNFFSTHSENIIPLIEKQSK